MLSLTVELEKKTTKKDKTGWWYWFRSDSAGCPDHVHFDPLSIQPLPLPLCWAKWKRTQSCSTYCTMKVFRRHFPSPEDLQTGNIVLARKAGVSLTDWFTPGSVFLWASVRFLCLSCIVFHHSHFVTFLGETTNLIKMGCHYVIGVPWAFSELRGHRAFWARWV